MCQAGDRASAELPDYARRSPVIAAAFRFARDAHEGARSRGDTRIDHPAEVARLLAGAGYPDHVVAAALLHDVLEDTATEVGELRERFGPEVARLVASLTEDRAIDAYGARKAALRAQAAADGAEAAAIFAADKLASTRRLRGAGATPPAAKLDHYERTFELLCDRHPQVPFLGALGDELALLRRAAPRR
jgi:(p)ppGpp synthase/HD superfamily hydrolase